MESNGPQSGTIRDVHFRTAQPARTAPRAGIGWLIALILLVAVAVGVYWIWFRPKATPDVTAQGQGRGAGREVPVVASSARTGDLPIYLNGLGTVTPFNLVTVRSRVEGQIMKIGFTEGQDVKVND